MKKVLGLAILSILFATPAFAGETFSFGQWSIQRNRTDEEATIDDTRTSNFKNEYTSTSDTTYIEGGVIHRAGSQLNGSVQEDNTTRVWGTINRITNSYNGIYESSVGIQ